jgi:hypothetical protein
MCSTRASKRLDPHRNPAVGSAIITANTNHQNKKEHLPPPMIHQMIRNRSPPKEVNPAVIATEREPEFSISVNRGV